MPRIGPSEADKERPIRAQAAGMESIQRAHAEGMRQREAQMQEARAAGATYGGLAEEGLRRRQQLEQQDEQFKAEMELKQKGMALEAAKAGFEPRAAKLKADMDRGEQQTAAIQGQPQGPPGGVGPMPADNLNRLKEQTGVGHELDSGTGPWQRSAEGRARIEHEQKLEDYEAVTKRINAMAYQDSIGSTYRRQKAAGEHEEAKNTAQISARRTLSMQETYDRFMQSKPTKSDWDDLKKMAAGEDVPPELIDALKSDTPQWTPRVQQFARAMVSKAAIEHIINTGDIEALGNKIDWGAPKMQSFREQFFKAQDQMRMMGPEFAAHARIDSTEAKNAFLNRQAALRVYFGMDQINKFDVDQTGFIEPGQEQENLRQQGQVAPLEEQTAPAGPPLTPESPGNQAVNERQALNQRRMDLERRISGEL